MALAKKDKEQKRRVADFGGDRRYAEVQDALATLNAFRGSVWDESRLAALTRFHTAVEKAYPPDFWENFERLKAGDADAAEMAIAFMEADPWFFRSGYVKQRLATYLKRVKLTPHDQDRLRSVIVQVVQRRAAHEYSQYRRLARVLATPDLQRDLHTLAGSEDVAMARRARWMLDGVEDALRQAARSKI